MNSVSTVTDPSTGKIIVPTGSCTLGSASCGTLIYDTVLKTATRVPNVDVAAPGIPRELGYYALAWSTERKTAMLYGGTGDANGNGGSSYNTQVLEYSPSSEKWTVVNTSGTSPGPIKGACWVPAFNGTFMVLFGGEGVGEVSGGIFFLNIKTLAWTRGDDIEISLRRVNHVCTTAGDSFVAWGGGTRMFSDEDFNREPVIYDMKRGKWTRDFSLVSMMEPAPTSRPAPLGDSPSTGAIAGGIAGGLVVILAAGFIIYRRRKSVAHSIKIEIEQNPQNPDQNQSQKPSIKEEVSPASTPLAGGDSVVKVETGVPVWSPPTPSITNGLEPFVSALTPHQPRNPHQPQTPQPPEEYLVWHNPQEYPVAQTPQERYPMPPSPQHQQLPYYPPPSTSPMLVHDPQAPSASTSPELPLHRPQQIQGHIEPEAERRRWIQQQELEQLELEHRIRQKRLEIERLREEQ
ncbi:hypothetical protein BGZ81_001378 [Podila clonocystis]|nr:hypothetical protein BGZ81_001378 [Podila clonocystis]